MLVVLAVRYLKISTNYKLMVGKNYREKNSPLSLHSAPLLKNVYVPHCCLPLYVCQLHIKPAIQILASEKRLQRLLEAIQGNIRAGKK